MKRYKNYFKTNSTFNGDFRSDVHRQHISQLSIKSVPVQDTDTFVLVEVKKNIDMKPFKIDSEVLFLFLHDLENKFFFFFNI